MKKLSFLASSLIACASAFGLQQLERKAPITQATIYNDRCEIARTLKGSYQPEEYQARILDLPQDLFDNSVRAAGRGSAEVKITGVKIETIVADSQSNQRYRALEDSLNSVRDQVQAHDDRLELLSRDRDYLERIKTATTTPAVAGSQRTEDDKAKPPATGYWQSLYGFYDARHDAISKETRSIERAKRQLQSRIEAMQSRLQKVSSGARLGRKNVLVNFTVAQAGAFDLEINYVMMGASWNPLYDVRVSAEDKSVELGYYGMIYQRTGEDWKDVKVVLSTARPSVSGDAPVPSPWYVDVYSPGYQQKAGFKGGKEYVQNIANLQAQQSFSAAQEAISIPGARSDETASYADAEVEATGTSYVFATQGLSDIPSDGEPHKIPIAFEKLDAEFEHTAVPRLKEHAYLRGRIRNTTDYPFINGDVNIFFGNNFVGTSAIGTVIPSEKFTVSLGVDEGIKVKRQKTKDLVESGRRVKRTFAWKVSAQNLKKETETITVREQYPVARNDQIKVKLVSPEFDDEKAEFGIKSLPNGMIEWKLRLAPGEKREMILEYTVEYPANAGVSGL
ncbi:MAG: mucoidy inhibitor MuiA family protein [Candidatus Edwardsbacteria bacterium]|nr:mucoidy inhibitor MuiA family protein [Candidatus Edwardsbacteria bacterium]